MIIDNVKKLDELDSVLRLANSCFQLPENGSTRYSRDFWTEKMNEQKLTPLMSSLA